MAPVSFQLAVQGGGARVFDLLTALQIVQQLERQGKVQVTRLAGTSAGALAVAAYGCAPDSMDRIQQHLRTNGARLVAKITGGQDPKLGLKAGWRLWRGRALFSMAGFREVVHELINVGKAGRADPWKSKMFFYASDMATRDSRVQECPGSDLVEAILDSAALPFAFRAARDLSSNPRIDGGLCENLPSEILLKGQEEFGPVLAISFPNPIDGSLPTNVFEYLGAMFSTAINHSVSRAKESLGAGAVLSIDSRIGTFEFSRALKQDQTPQSKLIQIETERWLELNISRLKNPDLKSYSDSRRMNEMMENILLWYRDRHFLTARRSVRSELIVFAESLASDDNEYDTIEKNYYFAPLDLPLECFHLLIGASVEETDRGAFEAWDPEGLPIKVRLLPTLDKTAGRYGGLLLFDPPLRPMGKEEFAARGAYHVRYTTRAKDGLSGLKSKGSDHITMKNIRTEVFEEVQVAVFIPSAFKVSAQAELRTQDSASQINSLAGPKFAVFKGRCPPGYKTMAWEVQNLGEGPEMRINLYRQQ